MRDSTPRSSKRIVMPVESDHQEVSGASDGRPAVRLPLRLLNLLLTHDCVGGDDDDDAMMLTMLYSMLLSDVWSCCSPFGSESTERSTIFRNIRAFAGTVHYNPEGC